MQTFDEQRQFFQHHWPELKAALELDGPQQAIAYIQTFDDELERRVLYVHSRAGLVMDEWEGKSFDPYIEICDAGIAEMLRQAEAAPDAEIRARRIRGAHVISYNLAADLADCWPGDDAPRSQHHFERGLRAAVDCLGWCDPDDYQSLSADWWAKGMHELSLERPDEALASWGRSLDLAHLAAEEKVGDTDVSEETTFGVILGSGYVGIGMVAAGDATGQERLDAALVAFRGQLDSEEKRDDAQFGIDQLEAVRATYLS